MKITICVEFVSVLVSLAFVPDFQLNFIYFALWVVPLSGLCKPIEHLRATRAFMYIRDVQVSIRQDRIYCLVYLKEI